MNSLFPFLLAVPLPFIFENEFVKNLLPIILLFGSVLREDFNVDSDIDLLVSFAEDAKITFFDLDTIEEEFSKLFNRPVDVVTKAAIERSHNWIRRKNILDNSQVIYEQRS